MPDTPELVPLTKRREVEEYLAESGSLGRTGPEAAGALRDSAMEFWLGTLVRKGHTGLPPFFVHELLLQAAGDARGIAGASAGPPKAVEALCRRYDRALADFLRLEKFRPILEDAHLRRNFPAIIREFLTIVAEAIESRATRLPAFHHETLTAGLSRRVLPTGELGNWHCLPLWEAFVDAFRDAVDTWLREEREGKSGISSREGGVEIDMERLRLLLHLSSERSSAAWDLASIEHTLEGLTEPALAVPEERRLFALLPNLRVERVRVRSHLPEGGYVGLRPNGGIEEVGSVAPSELAFPRRTFLEKAFNRRLAVFERPLQRIRSRKLDFCLFFLDSDELRLRPSDSRLSFRTLAVSALVRVLFELGNVVGRCEEGSIRAHVFLPGAQFARDLTQLRDVPRRSSLPFFLDETKTGELYQLFARQLVGAGPDSPDSPLEWETLSRVLCGISERADEIHMICIGGQQSMGLRNELIRFAEERMDLGQSGSSSLSDARVGENGWNLLRSGSQTTAPVRGVSSTVLIRQVIVHLVERLLGINVIHLGQK